MTPLEALAQAVEAGRAGQPPSPEALAVLGAVLQALQDGTDPAHVLAPKQARQRGRPRGKTPRSIKQEVRAIAAMAALMNKWGINAEEAARRVAKEFHKSPHTLYENWWKGKSDPRKGRFGRREMPYLRAKGMDLAQRRAEWDAVPPPMDDRPDASEDFKS